MANLKANLKPVLRTLSVLALAALFGASEAPKAHAIALNKCTRIVHNPQVNRETLVNACNQCVVARIERRRPGTGLGTPSMRDYTLPAGARQPLPFMGPGKSRITSETPCPQAR